MSLHKSLAIEFGITIALLLGTAATISSCQKKEEPQPEPPQYPRAELIGVVARDDRVGLYIFNDNEAGNTCYIAKHKRATDLALSCVPMEKQR